MSDTLKISTGEGMTKIQSHVLVKSNDPILHAIAPAFDFANPPRDPAEVAEILQSKMKEFGGIGLSACQIGLPYRAFAMGVGEEVVTFFNPVVLEQSTETFHEIEGCLSFPNFFVGVNRPLWVKVAYQSFDGATHEKTFTGLTARCFHHETDHLNGITFDLVAGPMALKLAAKRKQKIEKRVLHQIQNLSRAHQAQLKARHTTPLLQKLMANASIGEGLKKQERKPYTKHLLGQARVNAEAAA